MSETQFVDSLLKHLPSERPSSFRVTVCDSSTKTPKSSSLSVLTADVISETTLVIHEIVKASAAHLGQLHETEVYRHEPQCRFISKLVMVHEHHHQRPRNVVG